MTKEEFAKRLGITEDQAQEQLDHYKKNPILLGVSMTDEDIYDYLVPLRESAKKIKSAIRNIVLDQRSKDLQRQGYSEEDAKDLALKHQEVINHANKLRRKKL